MIVVEKTDTSDPNGVGQIVCACSSRHAIEPAKGEAIFDHVEFLDAMCVVIGGGVALAAGLVCPTLGACGRIGKSFSGQGSHGVETAVGMTDVRPCVGEVVTGCIDGGVSHSGSSLSQFRGRRYSAQVSAGYNRYPKTQEGPALSRPLRDSA